MARNESVQWQLEAGAYEVVAKLPLLPTVIRYYDDFDDKQRSIREPATAEYFSLHIDGRVVKVGFDHLPEQLALLIKHVFLYLLGEGLAPSSASKYTLGNKAIGEAGIVSLLGVAPTEIGSFWADFLHATCQLKRTRVQNRSCDCCASIDSINGLTPTTG